MLFRFFCFLVFSGIGGTSLAGTKLLSDSLAVQNYINQMVREHQFSRDELQRIFKDTELHQSILDAISRPAESKPWYEYQPIFVTEARAQGGVKFWDAYQSDLKRAADIYGVPEEIIVAIIGVETRYGKHAGSYSVLNALSTLTFAYPPRSKFFRKELTQYLLMTREEGIKPGKQLGSYAGAMGMPQFMPSSFRNYAVDFNQNGKRDIWNTPADAIGSVANYFERHHWKNGQAIAVPVKVHGTRYQSLLENGIKPGFTYKELTEHGVIFPDGTPQDLMGSLIELEGKDSPEYWVGWENFYVISRYNHSALYSLCVYLLSEKIKQLRQ